MRTTNLLYRLLILSRGISTLVLITTCFNVNAQYQTYNDAVALGNNTYQLTPDSANMAGSVWNRVAQNLNYPFTVTGEMFLGREDAGADGIVFVMQNECVSGGTIGGGIGYSGLSGASLGVEFDTWENSGNGAGNQDNNDPWYDHIGIQAFGNVKHQAGGDSVLFTPQPIRSDSSNVEDSTWHSYEISWDPVTMTLDVYFEDSLRASITKDIINDIFSGDSVIYFGFTSSTGGFWGNNSIQIDVFPINGVPDQYICVGDTAVVEFINNTGGIELISLLKPIAASSYEGWPNAGEANDGNVGTRWSSQQGNDPEWITIDLLDQYELDSMSIRWETAAASNYEIQVSTDSLVWTTQHIVNDGVSGEIRQFDMTGTYRYVRIYGTARTTGYGYSIWEWEIYGAAQIEWTASPYLQFQGSDRIAFFPPESMPFQVKIPDKCNGPTVLDFWVYVDTISVQTSNRTICFGDSTDLYANVVGNFGAVIYSWDQGIGIADSATVSPGADITYQVVVTDTVGCSDTATIDVVVNSLPVVDAGVSDSICRGQQSTLLSASVGMSDYNWDNGLGSGISHSVSPDSSTIYSVTATDGNNCVDTDSVLIYVRQLPNVIASVDTFICPSGSTTISAIGALTYNWDNSLGTGDSHLVSPTNSTYYRVVGTDEFGCFRQDSVFVTVNPALVLDAGADRSICIGDSTTLTATGAVSYDWDNSLGNGMSHSVQPSISTKYIVEGDDGYGCKAIDSVMISVNSLPVIAITPDTSLCLGSAINIEATGGTQYFWNQGIGLSNSVQSVSPSIDTRYTVLVTDVNSCYDTTSVLVRVHALPVVTTSGDTSICLGDNLTISAGGVSSYIWDQGLGSGQSHNVSPLDTTIYTVIGTDSNGCIDTSQLNVAVSYGNSSPYITMTVDNANICVNDPIQFSVSSSSGLGPSPNYEWYVNNNLIYSGLSSYISSGLSNGDIIEVRVDNAATCSDFVTVAADTSIIVLTPNPVVSILDLGYSCDSLEQSFMISMMSDSGASGTWDWVLNGAIVASNTSNYILANATEGDVVNVSMNSSLECATSVTSNSILVEEPLCDCEIFIPNAISPNDDLANDAWEISGLDCYEHIVSVYNRYGGLVYESRDYRVPWNGYRNGQPMPVSTYYYVVTTISSKGETKDYTGPLTILR